MFGVISRTVLRLCTIITPDMDFLQILWLLSTIGLSQQTSFPFLSAVCAIFTSLGQAEARHGGSCNNAHPCGDDSSATSLHPPPIVVVASTMVFAVAAAKMFGMRPIPRSTNHSKIDTSPAAGAVHVSRSVRDPGCRFQMPMIELRSALDMVDSSI